MKSSHNYVFLLALICISNATSDVSEAKRDEEISLRQIYTKMDKNVKNLVRENLKSAIRALGERSQELNVSTKCKENAFKLMAGLRNLEIWALNFVDATGKLSDGLMSGNLNMYGNYDQCLNASVEKKSGVVDFRGQYCLVTVATYLPKPELTPDISERAAVVKKLTQNLSEVIRVSVYKYENLRTNISKIGLCVPSGCDTNDLDKLIKYAGKQVLLNVTLDYCDTEDTLIYFTTTRIAILCIYASYILLVIVSSVIERYSTARKIEYESPVMRGLICFSLPYNFQKFTSTKVTEGNLSFLNGIRVLTLFYVIFGHRYFLKFVSGAHRNVYSKIIYTWAPRFFFQIVVNSTFSVDVFFFIGGFLNCYLRAKKNFTYFSLSSSFMILIHRLMRIYPVYIFTILLKLLLDPRGPFAHSMNEIYYGPCKTDWWKNIIFINNFYFYDACLHHSWYLAADMQFFIVALFTIPLLFRNPKIGVMAHLAIIFLSTTFTAFRAWEEKVLPTYLFSPDFKPKSLSDLFKLYYLPYSHSSAYFGGVLLGYFVTKRRHFTVSKITLVIGWIIASTIFCTMIFITKNWHAQDWTQASDYKRLAGALYFATFRVLCSWSVGWLLFCCLKGHGGFINNILSWKVWVLLNRLCLSAYLLSVILQLHYIGNLRTAQDFQHEIEIWNYFGDITVTCLLAVPVVLFFESPFIALQTVIFPKKGSDSKLKKNKMKTS